MAKKKVVASTSRATHSEKQDSTASVPANQSSMNTILLDQSLDIAGASQLQQLLIHVLQANAPVALDASNVTRVDTAALQVLTAFFKDAEAANVAVKWQKASDYLVNAAGLLGLVPSLHLTRS